MTRVGLHLRISSTLHHVFEKALRFELPFFQSFLLHQKTGAYVKCTQDLIKQCKEQGNCFGARYLHGSYYINLASAYEQQLLKKELTLAKRLSFTHIVFHPGAITDGAEKEVGINRVAQTLNSLLKHEDTLKIVLENSAHAHKSIGGTLQELAAIKAKLDHPEKVQFCIDTAHAYVFGYNLADEQKQELFIQEAVTLLGKESLALIHLNDTQELLNSKIDRHCTPGQGNIGHEALKRFISHPQLAHLPLILELPEITEEEELHIIQQVRLWKL
jgi:deoxyribonuclease IV